MIDAWCPDRSWDDGLSVVCRNRPAGRVLLAGVGFARDGRMWTPDDPSMFATLPGYDDAPEPPMADDFGIVQ